MKEFVVIGLGRFGTSVASSLTESGHRVLAIDISEEKVQHLSEMVTHAVQADATDEEALKALGIRNFEVVIVAIGEDMQANIMATIILKELGIPMVVAKALNERHGKLLEKIGADKVVYPERDMGLRVARALASGNVLDYIQLSPKYSIEEVLIPEYFVGKSLGQLNLRAKYGLSVIAIKRDNQEVIAGPGADTQFISGDVAVVIGDKQGLKHLEVD